MDILITSKEQSFDVEVAANDLRTTTGLETAILMSLFTDARCVDSEIPDNDTDPRGWWGDEFSDYPNDRIGSRLWLLRRQKNTEEVRTQAKQYVEDSLSWLVKDGVAQMVSVTVSRISNELIGFEISVTRPTGNKIRFDYVWGFDGVQ